MKYDSPAIKAMLTHQKRMADLFNTPAMKAMRTHQKHMADVFNTPAMEAIRTHQKRMADVFNTPAMKAMRTQQERLASMFDSPAIKAMQIQQEKLFHIITTPSLDMLSEASNIITPELISDISSGYIHLNDTCLSVKKTYQESEGTTENYLITNQLIMGFTISLMFFILSYAISIESDDKMVKNLENIESNILDAIAETQYRNKHRTYYVVKRAVELWTEEKTNQSKVVTILYPEQRVELLKRNNKWIYVSYFDHKNKSYKLGWVYKKYLRLEK